MMRQLSQIMPRGGRTAWNAVAWVVVLPLLLNAVAISGWLDADPLVATASIAVRGGPGLLPGTAGFTDPNAGWTTQALGRLAATLWLEGHVPWWNPYSGVGMPLAAEMQLSALFLPFSLLLALNNGVLWLKLAMQVLAGLGTLALLRRLDAGWMGATAAATIFELNGTFGWYGGYAPCLPVAFLPLFLLGIEQADAAAASRRAGGWALVAMSEAYSLYAGFPETAYLDGLFALAWAGLRVARSPARLVLVGKLTLGGTLGLMLAAPILVPFLDYLRLGTLGGRLGGQMAWFGLEPRFAAILLFPHIYGLPSGFLARDPTGTILHLFAFNGGWLGVALCFLAVLGATHRPRQPGLRRLLAAWLVAALGKTFAIPGPTDLFNLLPALTQVSFPRYGPPTWTMAAVVLAGLALDDWRRGDGVGPRGAEIAAAAVLACGGFALQAGESTMTLLRGEVAEYLWYPGVAVGGAVAALGGLVFAWERTPSRRGAVRLFALATVEAAALYGMPMLAGKRNVEIDRGTIDFLQRNLGLQRFLTFGPLQANYGAYFRIAGLNHEVIPVPTDWADYMTRHIDERPFITEFSAGYPPTALDSATRAPALRARISAYRETGVRYVLARPGDAPFGEVSEWDVGLAALGQVPLALGPGQSTTGTLFMPADGVVRGASVVVGTYFRTSTGRLLIAFCRGNACAAGVADLAGAVDNAPLAVRFADPLEVRAGEAVSWRIVMLPNPGRVAVWLWPEQGARRARVRGPGGAVPGAPRLTAEYDPPLPEVRLVHRSPAADVWELPAPEPYFAAPGCVLAAEGREHVQALCAAPAQLLRRELYYPGWRAAVDGTEAPIERTREIFQEVALPAGASEIVFSYAPPFLRPCLAAFGLALLVLAWGVRPARRLDPRMG